MEVVGYQTLEDKDNIDEIEMDGPYQCTHRSAWLGTGRYLWDTNFQWALEWGPIAYCKYGKDFVIGKCKVVLDEHCYDLHGSVAHWLDFKEIVDSLIDTGYLSKDKITVPKVIEYLKKKGLFDYKSIRAVDYPGSPNKLAFRIKNHKGRARIQEHMLMNQRVQICVIEKKDVILPPFLVVYPEKYLN